MSAIFAGCGAVPCLGSFCGCSRSVARDTQLDSRIRWLALHAQICGSVVRAAPSLRPQSQFPLPGPASISSPLALSSKTGFTTSAPCLRLAKAPRVRATRASNTSTLATPPLNARLDRTYGQGTPSPRRTQKRTTARGTPSPRQSHIKRTYEGASMGGEASGASSCSQLVGDSAALPEAA